MGLKPDTKSNRELSRAWKPEFNKRAFIESGVGAGHAYDQWKHYEALAEAEEEND